MQKDAKLAALQALKQNQQQETILIVDDVVTNIELLGAALANDYRVLTATNGKQAIELAKNEQPQLILLDVVMPDMSGHEVCHALKADPLTQNIPIIFVTGKDAIEDELRGLAMGAVDYFRKPFSIPLVKVRVHNQIELIRKTRLLEEMAWLDGLTGIANRRLFDTRFADACRYAQRNNRHICVMLLDIDYFKQYNDKYGHTQGDDVLKTVAETLSKGASRPFDLVARYGGEEFAILLTDTDKRMGMLVAEKVREMIEELAIEHVASPIHKVLTISVGVATSNAENGQLDTQTLLQYADQCLYQAKDAGRNTVVSTDLPPKTSD